MTMTAAQFEQLEETEAIEVLRWRFDVLDPRRFRHRTGCRSSSKRRDRPARGGRPHQPRLPAGDGIAHPHVTAQERTP